MGKHVVFISLPMSGLSDEEIQNNLSKARAYYLIHNEMDIRDVAFVDNFNADEITAMWGTKPEYKSIRRLGYALCRMSSCDEVLFYPGWEKARGCRVERKVCHEYDIPFHDMEEST